MSTTRISPDQDRVITAIARGIAIYTVLAGAAGLLLGIEFMGGVLVGGALAYFNFVWFAGIIRGVITGESSASGFALKTVAKVLLLYGAVGVIVGLGLVNVIAFLVGISGLIVGVAAAGFSSSRSESDETED